VSSWLFTRVRNLRLPVRITKLKQNSVALVRERTIPVDENEHGTTVE